MAGNKTTPTQVSVAGYIAAKANEQQRSDCDALIALLGSVTGQPPTMWGPSIVGFGSYRYTYESGRTGEAPLAGFAIRGRELVVYLDCEEGADQDLLAKLGKHRIGKSCLYFKQLSDLDQGVLEQLVHRSVAATQKRHA